MRAVPLQMAYLPELQSLCLERVRGNVLSTLAANGIGWRTLRRLELNCCSILPEWLPTLTQLSSLTLSCTPTNVILDEGWEGGLALSRALEPLTRLSTLLLDWPPTLSAFPPSLAGLRCLERFGMIGQCPPAPSLPSGDWQGSLKHLLLPAAVAASSLSILSAAPQLQTLQVYNCELRLHPQQLDMVPWAGQQSSLTRLRYDTAHTPWPATCGLPPNTATLIEEARCCRPGLAIEFVCRAMQAWKDGFM